MMRLATDEGLAALQVFGAIIRGWMQIKSWELRAAMSLCCLWRRQGKREEAQQLLAEIYGWFTEGFDTPDLKDARELLEELAVKRAA